MLALILVVFILSMVVGVCIDEFMTAYLERDDNDNL